MKKYLMTGVAALALCAGFTACSGDEIETLSQTQIVQKQYDAVFIKTFGQPAKNHTWGFSNGTTRAIDVNGNLWEETPLCTEAEQKLVFDYVNMTRAQMTAAGHLFAEAFPRNIENYYITQVYTGTDTYNTVDGSKTGTLGSACMNNLHIAMKDDAKLVNGALTGANNSWAHINNFNAGSNMNYGGNTLILDGGTKDFAYECSEDSRYHNKWIAVKGDDIHPSLIGKYYICFDFISENPQAQTAWRARFWNPEGNNGGEWEEKNFSFDNYYTVDDLKKLTFTVSLWSVIQGKNIDYTYSLGDETKVQSVSIDNAIGGNKIYTANDVYTDWIVRIVEAEPEYDGRIMGEDLSAKEGSDFDFNDVVFDFKITSTGAKIRLQAAGGTLPLKIGGTAESDTDGHEVHDEFGVNTGIMVNTAYDGAPLIVTKPAVTFDLEGTFEADGSDIPVFVKKDGVWMELTARRGNPASKFCCKTTTKWVDEYISIELAYPKFAEWVKDPSVDWESEVVAKYVNLIINQPGDNK